MVACAFDSTRACWANWRSAETNWSSIDGMNVWFNEAFPTGVYTTTLRRCFRHEKETKVLRLVRIGLGCGLDDAYF